MAAISYKTRQILKIACLAMNGFFILFGLLTIGLSIYAYVYKAEYLGFVFNMRHISVSVIIIIFCGSAILAFSFVGLCALIYPNRFILIVYICFMMPVALLSISAIVMAIVYKKTWYIDEVRQDMRDNLQKYYGVPRVNVTDNVDSEYITRIWDQVQERWYCCGVEDNSWGIYRQSQWYNNQPGDPGTKEYTAKMVPLSCCLKSQYGEYFNVQRCQNWILGPPNVQSQNFNEALIYSGCYVEGRKLLTLVSNIVIGLGVCITVLLIVASVLKIILLIAVVRDDASADRRPVAVRKTRPARMAYLAPVPTYPDPSAYPSASAAADLDAGGHVSPAYSHPYEGNPDRQRPVYTTANDDHGYHGNSGEYASVAGAYPYPAAAAYNSTA